MKKKIFITREFPKEGIAELTRHPEIEVVLNRDDRRLSGDEITRLAKGSLGLITQLTENIDQAIIQPLLPELKIIANFATGYDNIDVAVATKNKVWVTNTPGVSSQSVAEFTLALILSLIKRIAEGQDYLKKGKYGGWQYNLMLSHELKYHTLGVVGAGQIGSKVIAMASQWLGMKVIYTDIKRNPEVENATGARLVPIAELIQTADIISLHCNLTRETWHLIGAEEFKQMKAGAILINTARGPVIDEKALVAALPGNRLAGVGLDVFENEPEPEPELVNDPRVIITPHIASATYENRIAMAKRVVENIIAAVEGRTPADAINKLA